MELTKLQSLEVDTLNNNQALKGLDSLQDLVVWNVIECVVDENPFRFFGRELGNLISLKEVDITFNYGRQMEQVLIELLFNRRSRMQLQSITWRFTETVTSEVLKWMSLEVLLHGGMENLRKLHLFIPL